MSPLEMAVSYAKRMNWPVYPRPDGRYIGHGWHDATTDITQITKWWKRWPRALIAMPTGVPSGIVVLDIDIKNGKDGFEDWARLDPAYTLMPSPIALTPSGGWHIYLAENPDFKITPSVGKLGKGLDVLADGTSVTLPTPGWRYRWDKTNTLISCPLKPAPAWLSVPQEISHPPRKPVIATTGLSPYGEAALVSATDIILRASNGEQHVTLRREAFRLGTLAGAGGIPEDIARDGLLDAALRMPSYPSRHGPWRSKQLTKTVKDCFDAGLRHPRQNATNNKG